MQINEDFNINRYQIRSCTMQGTAAEVVIIPPLHTSLGFSQEPPERPEDITVTRSAIVMPGRLVIDWPPQNVEDLRPEHFAALLEAAPEVVLLGTGTNIRFPNPAYTAPLVEKGIGVEVMDTPAACRTYNILMTDGRDVAAALLI